MECSWNTSTMNERLFVALSESKRPPRTPEQRKRYAAKQMERTRADPKLRMLGSLRVRVALAVKNVGAYKMDSTMALVGCTPDQLRTHLEMQFLEGMTWENYGKWHIDHIRPCVAFDMGDPEEQRKCFHYSNLQPLWAFDNHSKGGKVTDQHPLSREFQERAKLREKPGLRIPYSKKFLKKHPELSNPPKGQQYRVTP